MDSRNKSRLDIMIDRTVKDAISITAQKIAKKMETTYQEIIMQFYADYPTDAPRPKYYNRTLSLREASSMFGDYMKGVKRLPGGKLNGHIGYEIVLNISSSNVQASTQNTHRADYDWIFDRAFMYGIHGFTEEENERWANRPESKWISRKAPHQMMSSPRTTFTDWFESFKRGNEPYKMWMDSLKSSIQKNMKR